MNMDVLARIPLAVRLCPPLAGGIRRGEPVTAGVPLPMGACSDSAQVTLQDERGTAVACEALVVERWHDQSIRWLTLRWHADAPATYKMLVRPQTAAAAARRQIPILDQSGPHPRLRIGSLQLTVMPDPDCLIVVSDSTISRRVRIETTDRDGRPGTVELGDVRVESASELFARVAIRGRVALGDDTLLIAARLDFYAELPVVRLSFTLHNPRRAQHAGGFWELGDRGSVYLRDASICIELSEPASRVMCRAEPGARPITGQPMVELYQDSSGGSNWRSPVHVNREGRVASQFCGYRLRTEDTETTGERAAPVLEVEAASSYTAAAVRHFWQNFPKALESDGTRITVRLFPRQFGDVHEIQGGEQKTHHLGIAFGRDPVAEEPLSWIIQPAVAAPLPDCYEAAPSMPFLTAAMTASDAGYESLVASAIEGPHAFVQKREQIDEFGWRHFGDLYADHESVGHVGDGPLVSHYNNQYDAIAGFAAQFMRSGDLRWWSLMDELAAHVADIDIYRTDQDKAAYNNGLFWHTAHYTNAGRSTHRTYPASAGVPGGGPSNEHNYSTGFLLHHLLTGSSQSREAVIRLADWVLAMDAGQLTPFRWLSRQDTGLASSTRSTQYHGPGRGAAHSITTLINAYRMTGDRRYLNKAESLIRRCIHPSDDLESRQLLDPENRWSYTVFLQTLGRYLHEKVAWGEVDAVFEYARASLLHYARWMAEHEHPYLHRPERLEYPNETWAAQDIRKGEVLLLAAVHARPEEASRFRQRGEFFYDYAVTALLAAPTGTFTRPMVIMIGNGFSRAGLERGSSSDLPAAAESRPFPPPVVFVPQKTVALRRARALVTTGLAMLTLGLLWLLT
jgi:hypothetical protein